MECFLAFLFLLPTTGTLLFDGLAFKCGGTVNLTSGKASVKIKQVLIVVTSGAPIIGNIDLSVRHHRTI